ncbi:MAG: hypothetical protein WC291_12125 [Thermodesulfovibrionales bacterium]|jgi:hypothetical protein
MSYTSQNFKTKKELKEALTAGKHITAYQPGLGTVPDNGTVYLEGPHYPAPHTWYAQGTMKDGVLVKVK